MYLTQKQLRQIIKEELGSLLKENINTPINVENEIFYWSTKRNEPVDIGFKVPKSGPIRELMPVEEVFEKVRKQINPEAPSRFNCVYVCPSLGGFCSEPAKGRGSVYKVKVTGKVFFTNSEEWVGSLNNAEAYAEAYWRGLSPSEARNDDPFLNYEALVDGDVVVIGKAWTWEDGGLMEKIIEKLPQYSREIKAIYSNNKDDRISLADALSKFLGDLMDDEVPFDEWSKIYEDFCDVCRDNNIPDIEKKYECY